MQGAKAGVARSESRSIPPRRKMSEPPVLSQVPADDSDSVSEFQIFPMDRSRGCSVISEDSDTRKSRESLESIVSSSSTVGSGSHKFRPKTLSIGGGSGSSNNAGGSSGFGRFFRSSFKGNTGASDHSVGSVPVGTDYGVPRINYVSAPSTPSGGSVASSWTDGDNYLHPKLQYEEDEEFSTLRIRKRSTTSTTNSKKKSKSRLSLNNLITPTDTSPSVSPRLIPKFLRNSFSRLWGGKTPTDAESSSSLAERKTSTKEKFRNSFTLDSIHSCDPGREDSPVIAGILPTTPSTRDILEEAKLLGLPIIPFIYPTREIVERRIRETRKLMRKSSSPFSDEAEVAEEAKEDGPRRKCDEDEELYAFTPCYHRPLEKLVKAAQRELMQETSTTSSSLDFYIQGDRILCKEKPVNQQVAMSLPASYSSLNRINCQKTVEKISPMSFNSPDYLEMS